MSIYFRWPLRTRLSGFGRGWGGAGFHRGQVDGEIGLVENVVNREPFVQFARGNAQAVADPRERGEVLQTAHAEGRRWRWGLAGRAGRDSLGPVERPP